MAETLCVCLGGFEKLVRSRGRHKIWLQGNILRPLLFNIYVNSLPNAVKNARVMLYADDAVLICTASTSMEPQAIFFFVLFLFVFVFFFQQPFISYLHTKEKLQQKKVAKLQFTKVIENYNLKSSLPLYMKNQ